MKLKYEVVYPRWVRRMLIPACAWLHFLGLGRVSDALLRLVAKRMVRIDFV